MLLKDTNINKRFLSPLSKKKIYTTEQLCQFFPRKYYNYREIVTIQNAVDGTHHVVCGKLCTVEMRDKNDKKYIVMSILQQDETWLRVMMFQNQYLYESYLMMKNNLIVVGGLVEQNEYGYSIINPDVFTLQSMFQPGIASVYPKVKGMADATLENLIQTEIKKQPEVLEQDILDKGKVIPLPLALQYVHKPNDVKQLAAGKWRMLFNDLLYFSMALKLGDNGGAKTSIFKLNQTKVMESFISKLPFALTKDQRDVVDHVIKQAAEGKRNNILLQGDVGCGKTIVAVCLMIAAAENGHQSVLMAPRTVLARQHYEEIEKYAQMCGYSCIFLHSNMKAKEKKDAISGIKTGRYQFIIGTHSCLAEDVEYYDLALIITDEEHLFGVKQKEALVKKANAGVHAVSMSATPIPRSLALVLYGDHKEICSIQTMPNGRKPIITGQVTDRSRIFPFMEQEIRNGHQCYVVCPAIEESDSEAVELVAIETVEREYRQYFESRGIRIGIVNGKMKDEDVKTVIHEFQENKVQILISTTVIEVGINVPNATVMAVEQAERFGLASLHQLRGRVGRSDLQSYCLLISEQEGNERLSVMCRTTNGFEIAEADLMQRGSGNLIGQEQSGLNRMVLKMIEHRDYYEGIIRPLADYCLKNGYGKGLFSMYDTGE